MPSEAKYSVDGFEAAAEVFARRIDGEYHPEDIDEDALADLCYIDVTGSKYRFLKRAVDIFGAVAALAILLVPFLFVMLLIYVDDPGPVFFRQYRVGLHGKRFRLYKFRSMRINTPKYMSTSELKDPDMFVTRVGRILRKLSIDELPQFINVLFGDMSLVGPRPLISDEYEIHRMRMKYGVYNVRPGITGLAQINGRDTVSPVEKVHWDVKYLQQFGFMMDVKILLVTVPKVLGRSDVVEGCNSRKV